MQGVQISCSAVVLDEFGSPWCPSRYVVDKVTWKHGYYFENSRLRNLRGRFAQHEAEGWHNTKPKVCATFPEGLREHLLKVPSFARTRAQRHNSHNLK
jgi:hypothetical protein